MLNRVESILRAGRIYFTARATRIGLRFLRLLLGKQRDNFSLSFDAELIEDGLGAQLQRQLSIKALAGYLGARFIPVPLLQIAVHPLDDFKTTLEMKNFLTKVNDVFEFNKEITEDMGLTNKLTKLDLGALLRLTIQLRLHRHPLHVTVAEVYSLVDSFPDMYTKALSDIELGSSVIKTYTDLVQSDICIHYRQGVGGKAIYPGQKISRELDPEYFLRILRSLDVKGKTISILTDAPEEDIKYYPDPLQSHLWVGTPGYKDGSVSIKGLKLREFFSRSGYEVQVISGGDLLSSLLMMIHCKTLLMSRSSLSYVAALLNHEGQIYYPPLFWHPPLGSWVKVREYED